MKTVKLVALLVVAALLGGTVSLAVFNTMADEAGWVEPAAVPQAQPASYNIRNVTVPTFDFVEVSNAVTPSVVHIKTKTAFDERAPRDPFDLFGQPYGSERPRMGSGSGVIVSEDGFIVTNNHVVEDASEIQVVLIDKRSYRAEVVGTDPLTDLAVLKIDAESLNPLQFGNSEQVNVGEWVLAVGNPFNLTSTVTAGIVSAKARSINLLGGGGAIESFIQTDAAVNPGNSGGALVSTEGKLVGINTAIASQTGQYAGYSFAVPVNIVKKVVTDILEFGTVQRGYIGVSIRNVTAELARERELESVQGVYVVGLMEAGAAAEAGVTEGDVILAVNDVAVNTVPELQEIIGLYRPGDKVTVTVRRDGDIEKVDVVLRNEAGTTAVIRDEQQNIETKLGVDLEVPSEEELNELGLDNGVMIERIRDGKFRQIGIPEGFVITSINKRGIRSVEDVERVLESAEGGVLVEGYHPDGSRGVFGFSLE